LSEFQQFTWEDIAKGEVTLRGKGNKYRRFFFQKQLRQEAMAYMKENGKTGLLAVGRFGPFSSNQDIDHVKFMYDRLEEGGTLAAITSQHWKISSEKKCVNFRTWLKEVHGKVFEIGAGEFRESGTNISTMAVVIKK